MKEKKLLVLIVFVSLFYKVFILLNSQLSFYSDDAIYATLAKFLMQGEFNKFFHPFWQPLFPALSAFVYLFVQNWEISLRLVSVLAGSLICVPLYYLSKIFLPKNHALAVAFLATFTSPLLEASLAPLSDMLSTLLIICAIATASASLFKNENKLFITSSIFFGLAFLARPEATMLFALTTSFTILYKIVKKTSLKPILFSILIFSTVISPYVISNKLTLGKLALSPKFSAQIQQEHAFKIHENETTWAQEVWATTPNYQSNYFSGSTAYISKNIFWLWDWFFIKAEGWKTNFINNFAVWSLVPILLGIAYLLRNKQLLWPAIYILYLLIIFIPISIFSTPFPFIRYLLWVSIIITLFFYVGTKAAADNLTRKIKNKLFKKYSFLIPALSLFLLPSFSFTQAVNPISYSKSFTNNYFREEITKAGIWIKENAENPHPKIMMRREGVEFYANGQTIYLPQELTLEHALSYAKKYNTDYLIAWEEELAFEKNLSILLDPQFKSDGLINEYQYPQENPKIIIYRIIY